MSLKIKKALHEELLKIKRQKKGIVPYLIGKGYSSSWSNNVSKNWKDLEIVGGPANTTAKAPVKSKAKTTKVATKKAPSKSKAKTTITPTAYEAVSNLPSETPQLEPASQITQVIDTTPVVVPDKELVVNVSQGYEVVAEVQVKSVKFPKFFLGSLIKILQKTGAKVTFNAGLDLDNSSEQLDGFTLAINETH